MKDTIKAALIGFSFLASIFSAPLFAQSTNWTRMGDLPDGMMVHISPETPKADKDGIVKMQTLLDSKRPFGTSQNSPEFLSLIRNYEVDCSGGKFRQVSLVGYPGAGATGEGWQESEINSSWRTPSKGSHAEDIFAYACMPKARKKEEKQRAKVKEEAQVINCTLSSSGWKDVGGWQITLYMKNELARATFIGQQNAWSVLTEALLNKDFKLISENISNVRGYRFGIFTDNNNYEFFVINADEMKFRYASSQTGTTDWGRCHFAPAKERLQ